VLLSTDRDRALIFMTRREERGGEGRREGVEARGRGKLVGSGGKQGGGATGLEE
jgi:hypothetical protein